MRQWLDIMRKALNLGVRRPDRTGVGTLALFGEQLSFDNSDTLPAVTTKKLAIGQVAAELACFVKGHHSLEQFHEEGCTIWDGNALDPKWADRARSEGSLGRVYGVNWRNWLSVDFLSGRASFKSTDQLLVLTEGLRVDPYGRRHLVTAWNPGELDNVCLPPCHVLFQCFVRPYCNLSYLDMRVDMRSVDLFLGLPFDIASYAILQRLLARDACMLPGKLVFQLGDSHLYMNHIDQVKLVLSRKPFPPPKLVLAPEAELLNFGKGMVALENYRHHDAVPAPLNV